MAIRRRWIVACVTCWPFVAAGKADEPKLEHAVAFELGAAEFHGGDSLTIAEVRCDRSSIEPDATCRVSGHYVFQSRDRATLLFSVTETTGPGKRSMEKTASVRLSRGEGDYALVHKLAKGYPHVTFYDVNGHPVSGVYFGQGDSLPKTKTWRYDVGPNDNDHLDR
jgi:hypothetical protein